MSQRLTELMTALAREQDPAVRGRAAVQLLRDLAEAEVSARSALNRAVAELRGTGLPQERIDELLGRSRTS